MSKKRILMIYRPVDKFLRGTGISAVEHRLKLKLIEDGFEVFCSKIILNIPPFHSVLSIIFYDIINPVLMVLANIKKGVTQIFFVDVAPCFFICPIKLLMPNAKITTLIHAYPEEKAIYLTYIRFLTKIAIFFSDNIICTTDENKEKLIEIYGDLIKKKIIVLSLGMTIDSPNDFKNEYPKKNIIPIFGYIGTSDQRKKLSRIVELMNFCSRKSLPLKIITAGPISVSYKNSFKSSISKYVQYEDRGVIHEDQKVTFFSDINAFIFPSQREGFGLPILESFYFKKPCIVYDDSSIPNILKEHCLKLENNLSNFIDIYNRIHNEFLTKEINDNYNLSLLFNWENYITFFRLQEKNK